MQAVKLDQPLIGISNEMGGLPLCFWILVTENTFTIDLFSDVFLFVNAIRHRNKSPRLLADEADLEEIYNTERHLLYVACTRARDHLLITCGGEPSEFLDDLV